MGRANHAVSGSRLNMNATAGAPRRLAPSRSTTSIEEPGRAGSTRNRASQSSRRMTVPSRRCGSMRITRSRVEGTAQTSSTAMARNENTCTEA